MWLNKRNQKRQATSFRPCVTTMSSDVVLQSILTSSRPKSFCFWPVPMRSRRCGFIDSANASPGEVSSSGRPSVPSPIEDPFPGKKPGARLPLHPLFPRFSHYRMFRLMSLSIVIHVIVVLSYSGASDCLHSLVIYCYHY